MVGWMMPKASFSPAPFLIPFPPLIFSFKRAILLVNSWAHTGRRFESLTGWAMFYGTQTEAAGLCGEEGRRAE